MLLKSFPALLSWLSKKLELSRKDTINLVCFIAFLHDIAKSTGGFCLGRGGDFGRAVSNALGITGHPPKDDIHTITGACFVNGNIAIVMKNLFGEVAGGKSWVSYLILMHHGIINAKLGGVYGPTARDYEVITDNMKMSYGGTLFEEIMRQTLEAAFRMFLFRSPASRKALFKEQDLLVMVMIAGIVSTADWIASDESNVEYESINRTDLVDNMDLKSFMDLWKNEIRRARKKMSGKVPDLLSRSKYIRKRLEFEDLFPGHVPNGLQEKVIQMSSKIRGRQFMAILEDTMGAGKTDAGMYLQYKAGLDNGSFYGLPTCATANAKLKETTDFLRVVSGGGVTLAHGMTPANKDYQSPSPFFRGNKKAVLARNSLGTLDQGMMGVLPDNRYFFIRLFGMFSKSVLIDEIHCYDVYSSTIIEEWVRCLSEMGCSIIFLSATLTKEKIQRLTECFCGEKPQTSVIAQYPRVSLALKNGRFYSECCSAEGEKVTSPSVEVEIRFVSENEAKAKATQTKDGYVLWFSNCVDDCIERYEAVSNGGIPKGCSDVVHARMRPLERRPKEKKALSEFGPESLEERMGSRSLKLLFGTQIFEQCFNIDGDGMFTDVCPMDLFLQRVGRLVRFRKRYGIELRPCKPVVYMIVPDNLDFSSDKVYDPIVLEQTYKVLKSLEVNGVIKIRIPDDIEKLVEGTYQMRVSKDGQSMSLSEYLQQENASRATKVMYKCLSSKWRGWKEFILTFRGSHGDTISADDALSVADDDSCSEAPTRTRKEDYVKKRVVCLTEDEDKTKPNPDDDPCWYLDRSVSLPQWWLKGGVERPWSSVPLKPYGMIRMYRQGRIFVATMSEGDVLWDENLGFSFRSLKTK